MTNELINEEFKNRFDHMAHLLMKFVIASELHNEAPEEIFYILLPEYVQMIRENETRFPSEANGSIKRIIKNDFGSFL